MNKNLYDILEIESNASQHEIKKKYRELALKYHPDKNPEDKEAENKFKEISGAYSILGNSDKRKQYDSRGTGTVFSFDDFNEIFTQDMYGNFDFVNIFDEIYGKQFSGKGRDKIVQVYISFKEAFTGTKREIDIDGKILNISIKKGIRNRTKLRIKRKGSKGIKENGDLFIVVIVAEDSKFILKGIDIYTIINIDIYTAVLGDEIKVNTPDNVLKIKIPPLTNNKTFRMVGKGFPVYENPIRRGNFFATINIVMPEKLSNEEKELFIRLKHIRKNADKR